ncbi:MAG: iron exporter MbfA [Microvirga sp.]
MVSLTFAMTPQRSLSELTDREVLALAIQSEEEDGRIYREFAERLSPSYPASAAVFMNLAEAESGHRRALLDLFEQRFGNHIPLVRREDVRGFIKRRPVWMTQVFDIKAARHQAETMEAETRTFYRRAAERTTDPAVRKLLGDLAEIEAGHEALAAKLESNLPENARAEEAETARRMFVLQIVQPGLAGLMDGSVSTLAPVFAAAFATQNSWDAFLVGMAASIGAGISMGFAEALSDDGSLTGRGHPWLRGLVCGLMTMLGGVGHTLPYLIGDFRTATVLAVAIVIVELLAISWIRARYMETPFVRAAFQVVVGGLLVFATGILIGSA